MKKYLSLFLILNMLVGSCLVFAGSNAYAASGSSAARLSAKKVSLDIGVKKTIKLKNAKAKVKWSSSNKKIAVVIKKRGSYGSTVTVKAKKHGKCTVTAVSGGKRYKCTVTVSKIKIKPLSSSSVEKSGPYKYSKKLGKSGGKAFNTAVSDFSFELIGKLTDSGKKNKQNILISPASILTAMVIAENGARGNTLAEMQNTMSGGIAADIFNGYMAGLNGRLRASKKLIYQQADSLWIRKNAISIRKSFLKKNKEYHNVQIYEAPFSTKTVRDINSWVYNNSRNMIDGIIDRLDPSDRMVIVDTIAFEGKWAEPFKAPHKDDFTSSDGTVSSIDMLSASGNFRFVQLNGGKGFVKYYSGDDGNHSIAFVGLVPPENTDVDSYVKSITGKDWINAWNSSADRNLRIKIPKFTYDYSASLKTPLTAMGIREAFTADADFSGITPAKNEIRIDDVLHKTHIELDENGTKAAAATAVVMKANSIMTDEPIEVYLDRPFLYALVDAKTGIPLFAGILYKPE